ncbi:MAG TPA: hypothetical protein VKE51_38945 [Vicinamibacterales bacterium]|nr:hypothetical protein [Vicinamibacterales bacterium]
MTRTRSITALTLSALLLSSYSVRADVRADEKTKVELAGMLGGVMKMFGGHAARDGVTATVIVKGDRKVTLDEERGQIIDLAEEKVYDLDVKKKSYKMTTFAELRRRFEEQQRKAAEQAKRSEDKSAKEKPAEPDPNAKQVEIDFDIKNTGQKKTINGFDTQEQVMTITVREKGKTLEQGGGMVLTSDMWIAPTIKAMKEVADFDVRYAQKLYGGVAAGVSPEQMAAAMAMYPMMKDALGKMSTEGAKLQGSAIQTTMTMDAVKSAEQMQQEAQASSSSASSSSDGSAKPTTSVSGALGGLLARRMKKNGDENKDGGSADKSRATFMTTTHEVLKVATDVSAADVAVPAGFKEAR